MSQLLGTLSDPIGKNTGMTMTMAMTENSMPLMTPMAKLNQNMSRRPSKRTASCASPNGRASSSSARSRSPPDA